MHLFGFRGTPSADRIYPIRNQGQEEHRETNIIVTDDDDATTRGENDIVVAHSLLLSLPTEIIHHILTFLDSQDLALVKSTCRLLKAAADEDVLWSTLLHRHIPGSDFPKTSPYPSPSYRDLFLCHHPYWFLPRNKIWISDEAHVGKLMLCKYDQRRGCIEGYRLLADRGPTSNMFWTYKPSVVIHTFTPRVHLWLDDPILSLPYEDPPSTLAQHQDGWHGELKMTIGRGDYSTSAAFFLSKDIPESAQFPGMSLWPPRTIPDMPRVRAESLDKFQSKGHRPSKYNEISQTTFRMRNWSQFSTGWARFGVRIGEEVTTWSTLDPKLYTPTEQKPYQGIFVGDYAGHGCEFLLVMQTDAAPPPPHRDMPSEYLTLILRAMEDEVTADIVSSTPVRPEEDDVSAVNITPNVLNENAHKGAIEAVKLTGDPHVPRGEHTFIADDISNTGLIRIAEEPPFRGARVVKSRGHVAARGFQNDEFIPSQLIMISPDKLAQYWVPFGHISFYERVDIDRLLGHVS